MSNQQIALSLSPPGVEGPVCGVDEAGRGPLAGAVVAAAVILDPDRPIAGLADSKKLTARRRETLAQEIHRYALAYAVGEASCEEIDQLNILQASMVAMQRAVAALRIEGQPPTLALARIDGNRAPALNCPVQTLVGGDALDPAISAASILAKTQRDAQMMQLHEQYPQYGFDRHKGYPTAEHRQRLLEHGPCAAHRRTFRPVRLAIEQRAGTSPTDRVA